MGPDIVFISNRGFASGSAYSRIWSMESNGSIRQLTDAVDKHEIQPTLSHDRTKLAFISDRDGSYAVYIANADGTNLTKLDLPGFNRYDQIALSPDGTEVAYSYNNVIWVKTIGSADPPLQLTNNSATASDSSPAWSPNGQQIAFSGQTSSAPQSSSIFIVNADGSSTDPYGTVLADTPAGVRDEGPAWSPDGTKIAFSAYNRQAANEGFKVYICRIGGSPVRLTTATTYEARPHWSINGRYIYYMDNTGEILRANVVSRTVQNMTNTDSIIENFTYIFYISSARTARGTEVP